MLSRTQPHTSPPTGPGAARACARPACSIVVRERKPAHAGAPSAALHARPAGPRPGRASRPPRRRRPRPRPASSAASSPIRPAAAAGRRRRSPSGTRETNAERSLTTNESGVYVATLLRVGTYDVTRPGARVPGSRSGPACRSGWARRWRSPSRWRRRPCSSQEITVAAASRRWT